MLTLICPICNKSFERKKSHVKSLQNTPTCSYKCRATRDKKSRKKLTCDYCEKTYYVPPSYIKWNKIKGRNNNFCSSKCRTNYYSENSGGSESLSDNGYIRVASNKYPSGYQYKHRIVMQEKLGRSLKTDEHVHHINGDKLDNRPENLEVVSSTEHHKKHPRPKGEKSKVSKLTREDVKKIRNLYKTGDYTLAEIGKKFGVCFQNISLIVNRKSWTHVE